MRGRLAALLAISALILHYGVAHAQDATWLASPSTGDFNTGSNWSTGTVPTGTAYFDTSSITGLSFSTDTTLGGWTFNTGASAYTFTNSWTQTFNGAGIEINGGSATITNNAHVYFYNSSTAGSATITNQAAADLNFHNSSTAGSATITNLAQGALYFYDGSTSGSASITNNGNVSFFTTSTAGSATFTNNNGLWFYGTSTAGSASITNIGYLRFYQSSTAGSATITNNSGGKTSFYNTTSGGTARFILNGTGALDLSALSSSGTTAGSIEGDGNVFLGSKNLAVGGNNLSTTFSGVIQDGGSNGGTGGSLTKEGSGTLTLSGTNTYTGATTVNGGTLQVDGSIASSSSVTVNAGGTLTGTGTVDPPAATTINAGGTLAPGTPGVPGTFMTITGNLVFQPGATYAVSLDPSSTTYAVVSGTASLAGTVNASLAPGSYVAKQYEILKSGGLGGTTFDTLSTSNLPASFAASLSYTTTDVLLNLTAALGGGTNLNGNQQTVANAINNYFNTGGGMLPAGFATLFGLTGSNLANALSQVSGEAATGAQNGAFQLMNEFFGLMLDRGFDGQGGALPPFALGYASETPALPDEAARAYAAVLKAPPAQHAERRWSVWAAGFGGYNKTDGDAAAGTNDVSARTYGGAAGLDYRLTPDTVVGFALSGGGTNWGLAQGLGDGRSDAFQAGVYGRTHTGPTYLAGALAFAEHWMSTDRFAFGGDHLTADFDAYDFGGRLEGGYRFGSATQAITPYAAVQAQRFHTPDYSETDLTGGGFGLSYASRNAHDTRSELGARFDTQMAATADAMLRLSGKLAWAHNWVSDPSLTAVFQSLPGSSFIVNGAVAPEDSALVSAAAELRFTNGVSLLAKFDGDFGNGSHTYAGTGTLRYTW